MHIEILCWKSPDERSKVPPVWQVILVDADRFTQMGQFQMGDDVEARCREFAEEARAALFLTIIDRTKKEAPSKEKTDANSKDG